MRKFIATLAIGALVISSLGSMYAKANTVPLNSDNYVGTGATSIGATYASAYTSLNEREPVFVKGEYYYIENYNTPQQDAKKRVNSAGADGYASIYFSITSADRSSFIDGEHSWHARNSIHSASAPSHEVY